MPKPREYPRPAPREPSADDKAQAEITAAAVKGMVDYMKPIVAADPSRLLKSLYPHEAEGLAVAAITAYVEITEQKRRELNDPVDDLFQPAGDIFA